LHGVVDMPSACNRRFQDGTGINQEGKSRMRSIGGSVTAVRQLVCRQHTLLNTAVSIADSTHQILRASFVITGIIDDNLC
jgi:hypothetical protein